jgi:glycosyltransferase involved in cell wall biosynthesis
VLGLVGKYPLARQSGSTSYLRALARAAGRAGYAPHVFCVGPRTETLATEYATLHVVRAPGGPDWPPLDSRAPLVTPWLAPAVVRFGRALGRPLLLHGLSLWGWTALVAARRLRRRGPGAAVVVTAYDTKDRQSGPGRDALPALPRPAQLRWRLGHLWDRRVLRPVERRVYTGADAVLVNYRSLAGLLQAAFGPGVPVRHAPYAAEAAFVHEPLPAERPPPPAGLPPGGCAAPLLVAVSRHAPHKGLDVLLEALARVRARGVAFRACLAGPGPLLATHRALAGRLGLGGAVALPGQVADPFPLLRHADLFALPSRGEGGSGSLALLEALQAGVAAVASACDGIPEDVVDGRDALLVPPGDAGALAEALARALGDAGLRRRLGAGARATFERRFAAGRMVEALRATYADLGFDPTG